MLKRFFSKHNNHDLLNNEFFISSLYSNIYIFTIQVIIYSLIAIFWVLLTPVNDKPTIFFNISTTQLISLIPILVLAFSFLLILQIIIRNKHIQKYLSINYNLSKIAKIILKFCFPATLVLWIIIVLTYFFIPIRNLDAYLHIFPVLILFFITIFQLMLFVPYNLFPSIGIMRKSNSELKRIEFLLTLIHLLAIFILIDVSRLGNGLIYKFAHPYGIRVIVGLVLLVGGLDLLIIAGEFSFSSLPKKYEYYI